MTGFLLKLNWKKQNVHRYAKLDTKENGNPRVLLNSVKCKYGIVSDYVGLICAISSIYMNFGTSSR